MKIRLAAPIQRDSILDGEGIRAVIWTQGCPHKCPGCHNPGTHSSKDGYLEDIEVVKEEIKELDYHDGITLSGGDPFAQIDACLEIAKFCKSINKSVWCFTGYTYEEIMDMSKNNKKIIDLLENIDILVDGRFLLNERSYDTTFRGSRNQRIIAVKRSLELGEAVIIKKYDNPITTYQSSESKYVFI